MTHTADVVICGAGIAGISVAYHLAVRHGLKEIVLVDERSPRGVVPRAGHGRSFAAARA